jgi:hypothetical protein
MSALPPISAELSQRGNRRDVPKGDQAECEVMRLAKAAVIRVIHDEPTFSEMFMSHLLTRNIRVEADLVDQLFNSSEKRLAGPSSPGELRQGG